MGTFYFFSIMQSGRKTHSIVESLSILRQDWERLHHGMVKPCYCAPKTFIWTNLEFIDKSWVSSLWKSLDSVLKKEKAAVFTKRCTFWPKSAAFWKRCTFDQCSLFQKVQLLTSVAFSKSAFFSKGHTFWSKSAAFGSKTAAFCKKLQPFLIIFNYKHTGVY